MLTHEKSSFCKLTLVPHAGVATNGQLKLISKRHWGPEIHKNIQSALKILCIRGNPRIIIRSA
jgi:hypothetical protein